MNPRVVIERDRIEYRSRITFRLLSDSMPLARRLRDTREKQVIWADSASENAQTTVIRASGVCWPMHDKQDMATLEVSHVGPFLEAPTVKMRHEIMVHAHV